MQECYLGRWELTLITVDNLKGEMRVYRNGCLTRAISNPKVRASTLSVTDRYWPLLAVPGRY